MCWWPNLTRFEKSDCPVWKTRVSDFDSFRTRSGNELNMKIWRSKYVWSMKKGRKNIKESIIVLTTKFDIVENWSVRFVKPEHPIFTMIRWSIFLNEGQLYIFHKLDHVDMFLRLCTCFSDNLVEFHSRNKKMLQTTRRWTQTEDLKPPWWSPCPDDQIDIWNTLFEA
jgi:hypothetical protein